MYNSTSKILEAANVLEKVAEYLEAEECEAQAKHAAAIREEYVAPIAQAVDGVSREMESKLAATDPDVLDFFKNTIGGQRGNRGYTPMGGAAEKVASDEADPLLSFCLGED